MTVRELHTKLQAINVQTLAIDAVRASTDYLAEVNRLQLRKGQNAEGSSVGKYSPGYGAYKMKLSSYYAPSGVPDLYVRGTFHKSIKYAVSGTQYTPTADDPNNLLGRYDAVLGINETHRPLAVARTTRELGRLFKLASGL